MGEVKERRKKEENEGKEVGINRKRKTAKETKKHTNMKR